MAVTTDIGSQVRSFGFFKFDSLGQFLFNLLQIVLIIGSLSALAFLIMGGIEFITSGGNQERTKSAKDKIQNALFGLALLAAVWIIWRLIIFFFGLSQTIQGPVKFNLKGP